MTIKHNIIVKWWDRSLQTEALLCQIKEVFAPVMEIDGVKQVDYICNVVDRPNRYDLVIAITMEESALPVYDASPAHKKWKQDFGALIEKKAIFDCEA